MTIPESQLETWSHQGTVPQSSATYHTIKGVLESPSAPYAGRAARVFLQGSYGNDTNIYAESDVDVVIRLDDIYFFDLEDLPPDERAAFEKARTPVTYAYKDFRRDVLATLTKAYGNAVTDGTKAIAIAAAGSRRKADVIVAAQHRRYLRYRGLSDQRYDEGIGFIDKAGQRITNYPRQHSENLTTKHQSSSRRLKPMIRIFKNLRSRLVDEQQIAPGMAPSYYLEGLLYNVPDSEFTSSFQTTVANCLTWILKADRTKFVCANEQYRLFHASSPVTWRAGQCEQFLAASVKLWNEW